MRTPVRPAIGEVIRHQLDQCGLGIDRLGGDRVLLLEGSVPGEIETGVRE
jgi:hypothetical protein